MEYQPAEPAPSEPARSEVPITEAAQVTEAAEVTEVTTEEPDRDQIVLEALEAELAVLESDLALADGARVDSVRTVEAPGSHSGPPQPDW